jgi:hypothetical protein
MAQWGGHLLALVGEDDVAALTEELCSLTCAGGPRREGFDGVLSWLIDTIADVIRDGVGMTTAVNTFVGTLLVAHDHDSLESALFPKPARWLLDSVLRMVTSADRGVPVIPPEISSGGAAMRTQASSMRCCGWTPFSRTRSSRGNRLTHRSIPRAPCRRRRTPSYVRPMMGPRFSIHVGRKGFALRTATRAPGCELTQMQARPAPLAFSCVRSPTAKVRHARVFAGADCCPGDHPPPRPERPCRPAGTTISVYLMEAVWATRIVLCSMAGDVIFDGSVFLFCVGESFTGTVISPKVRSGRVGVVSASAATAR